MRSPHQRGQIAIVAKTGGLGCRCRQGRIAAEIRFERRIRRVAHALEHIAAIYFGDRRHQLSHRCA